MMKEKRMVAANKWPKALPSINSIWDTLHRVDLHRVDPYRCKKYVM